MKNIKSIYKIRANSRSYSTDIKDSKYKVNDYHVLFNLNFLAVNTYSACILYMPINLPSIYNNIEKSKIKTCIITNINKSYNENNIYIINIYEFIIKFKEQKNDINFKDRIRMTRYILNGITWEVFVEEMRNNNIYITGGKNRDNHILTMLHYNTYMSYFYIRDRLNGYSIFQKKKDIKSSYFYNGNIFNSNSRVFNNINDNSKIIGKPHNEFIKDINELDYKLDGESITNDSVILGFFYYDKFYTYKNMKNCHVSIVSINKEYLKNITDIKILSFYSDINTFINYIKYRIDNQDGGYFIIKDYGWKKVQLEMLRQNISVIKKKPKNRHMLSFTEYHLCIFLHEYKIQINDYNENNIELKLNLCSFHHKICQSEKDLDKGIKRYQAWEKEYFNNIKIP